jgi:hypothetical protein
MFRQTLKLKQHREGMKVSCSERSMSAEHIPIPTIFLHPLVYLYVCLVSLLTTEYAFFHTFFTSPRLILLFPLVLHTKCKYNLGLSMCPIYIWGHVSLSFKVLEVENEVKQTCQ